MSREAAVLVVIGVAVLFLVLMLLAWRRRQKRDSALSAPIGVPEHAEVRERQEVLYVATTRHEQPLERFALKPLTYRARGEASITDRGLALSLDGAPTVFLASDLLVSVERATWTIDRVVEPGGLVRITWLAGDDTPVDSYLRLVAGDTTDFIRSLAPLCQAPQTGASA